MSGVLSITRGGARLREKDGNSIVGASLSISGEYDVFVAEQMDGNKILVIFSFGECNASWFLQSSHV